ncbi:MAG TPA: NAD(P)H-binding protein, partial [bacterium]
MTALVTGATGFIGRALCLRLAAAGTPVRALVRDPARAGDLAATPGVELVRGDLRDAAALGALVSG